MPVLNVQPANGGSKKYQIVDFRACFITDQPGSAVKGDGPATPNNGFIMDNNGVNSVQVIFLNPNALPNPPVKNGTINYVGFGAEGPAPRELTRPDHLPSTAPIGARSSTGAAPVDVRSDWFAATRGVHDHTTRDGQLAPPSPSARTASGWPPDTSSSRAWSCSTATGGAPPARSTWSCATATCSSCAR